jgi:hypothetical protein
MAFQKWPLKSIRITKNKYKHYKTKFFWPWTWKNSQKKPIKRNWYNNHQSTPYCNGKFSEITKQLSNPTLGLLLLHRSF